LATLDRLRFSYSAARLRVAAQRLALGWQCMQKCHSSACFTLGSLRASCRCTNEMYRKACHSQAHAAPGTRSAACLSKARCLAHCCFCARGLPAPEPQGCLHARATEPRGPADPRSTRPASCCNDATPSTSSHLDPAHCHTAGARMLVGETPARPKRALQEVAYSTQKKKENHGRSRSCVSK